MSRTIYNLREIMSTAKFVGIISRNGKQNQRFRHLLLQDHAWDKTTRLHDKHCYLFHDKHWASCHACVLCKPAPTKVPWTHPSSFRGRAYKKICFICTTTSWQREPGSSTHLWNHVPRVIGYHEVAISVDKIATLALDRCVWRNLVIACSAAEGW